MRGISLTQPWASLVALGAKHYETRSFPTELRGEFAIVASKSFPGAARALCHTEPFRTVLAQLGEPVVSLKASGPTSLPLGAVVAVGFLDDCIPTTAREAAGRLLRSARVAPGEHEPYFGDYSVGRFAWVLANVRALAKPVLVERVERGVAKAAGALGLYLLSDACEAAVRAQLVGGAS